MNLDFDELIDELEEEVDSGTISLNTVSEVQRKLGGFENMTDEEIKKFQGSQEYKEYKVDVTEMNGFTPNMSGKSVQEIMGLAKLDKKVGYSYNSLDHYDVDIDTYESIMAVSPAMQEILEEGEAVLPTFKYLYQDIFLSLYKYEAKILPEEDMHISTRVNRNIMRNLVNTPEHISLRRRCRLDDFLAAIGANVIAKKAIELIREELNKIKDLQKKKDAMDRLLEKEEEMDYLAEEEADIDELLEEAKMNGNTIEIQALQQRQREIQHTMEEMKALANKIAEECDELIENDSLVNNAKQSLGSALSSAGMEVGETRDVIDAWGIGGQGDPTKISFQNKMTFTEKIRHSPKLKKFTNAIGRMKETAKLEQKKKAKHGAVEIKGVTTGNKIQDTLPSDKMNLCNNTTKKDFYRRMSENGLLQYSKDAHKQKNKGPIIVCVDTSGSMSGDKEIWSKALTVGILEVAQLQKRDFACIIYSDYADEPIIIKKDEVNPNKVIDCAEKFYSGGTNFESPLRKSTELIKQSEFSEADIVFITDGDCCVSDKFCREFKQTKEDKGFKTLGVIVDAGGYRVSDSSLKEFCDNITRVSDIADLTNSDSETNKSIFASL